MRSWKMSGMPISEGCYQCSKLRHMVQWSGAARPPRAWSCGQQVVGSGTRSAVAGVGISLEVEVAFRRREVLPFENIDGRPRGTFCGWQTDNSALDIEACIDGVDLSQFGSCQSAAGKALEIMLDRFAGAVTPKGGGVFGGREVHWAFPFKLRSSACALLPAFLGRVPASWFSSRGES